MLSASGPSAATAKRSVAILGSTGSVGCSTIDLIERHRDAYEVEALTCHRNVEVMAAQALKLRPKFVAVCDETQYPALKSALSGSGIEVGAGQDAVVEAAARPSDWVMAAIVGAAGLRPTLTAVRRGAMVALANKETLVCAGTLMMAEVARHGATLLPVDSEHNAIFQVIDLDRLDVVESITLTASGGPFRTSTLAQMANVTPAQAVAHPNWSMGAKISVDSATMMNKGLELIEAFHLFPIGADKFKVLVHPQSVVHSMVSYVDGSVLAQLGTPDMRTPISFTLGWPRRIAAPSRRLDLAEIGSLSFEAPDNDRFPCLKLARGALQTGGSAPTLLNAANEVAVEAFLAGRIGFLDISKVVEQVLTGGELKPLKTLNDVDEVDRDGRRLAKIACERISRTDRVA
jgi:1-deoxy-D-xylulose-5-phosphate reductoisomerase